MLCGIMQFLRETKAKNDVSWHEAVKESTVPETLKKTLEFQTRKKTKIN